MRNTAKRIAALDALKQATGKRPHISTVSQTLYDTLESLGYWWDSAAGEWKNTRPPSTSMFKDDEGNPSGVLRVRLMGMAVDVFDFTHALTTKGWTLVDQSSEYPNRKGPGSRWYQTYKRD